MDTPDQDFDAAWDEAAAGTPAAAVQQETTAAGEEPAAVEDAEPAPEQAAEEPKQDEAAAAPPNTAPETDPTEDAIWADAPEALRTAFQAVRQERDELQHKRRSDAGRVAAEQRKAFELQRRIGALTTTAEQEDIQAYLSSEDYQKAKTEYGTDLGPVFTLIEGLAKNTASTQQSQSQLAEERAIEVAREVEGWLEKAAPDAVDLFSDPAYGDWLKQQPKFVRELHDRNLAQVVDPAEIVEICDRFRSHLGREKPEPMDPAPQVEAPQPKEFDRKREVQLQGSKSVASRAPIVTGPDENDYDTAWGEAAAAQEQKASARR